MTTPEPKRIDDAIEQIDLRQNHEARARWDALKQERDALKVKVEMLDLELSAKVEWRDERIKVLEQERDTARAEGEVK